MIETESIVYVIDDDAGIRNRLDLLIRSVGLEAELFSDPHEFLSFPRLESPSCLVLEVRLHGMSGLDFQRELAEKRVQIPVIFITAYGDIPIAVRAMKAGAVEFLTKPIRDQDLLDAIHLALKRDGESRKEKAQLTAWQERLKSLTPREREILPLLLSGLLNKQIAAEIGMSEAAVKVHRSQLMRKLGAASFADLIRMAERLGIDSRAA